MTPATRRQRRAPARAARRLARAPRRLSYRARRVLLAVAASGAVLAALYLFVVRELPVFDVEAVELSGASPAYGPRLRADLTRAAKTMTTLDVGEEELRAVARRYPAVVSLEVGADLPNRLSVRVVERPPVGTVRGRGGRRLAVAEDGTLLMGHPLDRPLPGLPGRARSQRRHASARTVAAARLAAGAPRALGAWLETVRRGREGWIVELRRGPELRFGKLADLPAKWAAAAAVLADRSARGARYVDLRLPDRPAAGGLAMRSRAPPKADDGGFSEPQSPLEGSPQP